MIMSESEAKKLAKKTCDELLKQENAIPVANVFKNWYLEWLENEVHYGIISDLGEGKIELSQKELINLYDNLKSWSENEFLIDYWDYSNFSTYDTKIYRFLDNYFFKSVISNCDFSEEADLFELGNAFSDDEPIEEKWRYIDKMLSGYFNYITPKEVIKNKEEIKNNRIMNEDDYTTP